DLGGVLVGEVGEGDVVAGGFEAEADQAQPGAVEATHEEARFGEQAAGAGDGVDAVAREVVLEGVEAGGEGGDARVVEGEDGGVGAGAGDDVVGLGRFGGFGHAGKI